MMKLFCMCLCRREGELVKIFSMFKMCFSFRAISAGWIGYILEEIYHLVFYTTYAHTYMFIRHYLVNFDIGLSNATGFLPGKVRGSFHHERRITHSNDLGKRAE